ncbi:hypothetical protein [Vibrio tapetis]|uniref:Uncharacterized protein n=1 Tax=Vibrio tapetis subsp. tapetis TaxID=1671868 RepID=A0A2N8ZDC6_9VIBR|nr:hypothetical protein [Vibrio tapetis]SON49919.1 protein of unknown function [Vibrio tapetis subsp. tapetis]
MNELKGLLADLDDKKITLSVRGLFYDQINLKVNGCYVFTHSKTSDKFEAQIGFLSKLHEDGRLYNPKVSKTAKIHVKQTITDNRKLPAKKVQNFGKSLESYAKLSLTKSRPESDEVREMEELIAEMRPLNFRTSKQLSKYIVDNNLGGKYPTISGVARMKNASDEWDFKGGFPPDIYKMICIRLGLRNQGTSTRLIGFSSYKSLI